MKLPIALIGRENLPVLEQFLGEEVRRTSESVVLRKEQWNRVRRMLDNDIGKKINISESSAVALRAYGALIKTAPTARTTPEGKMALIAAVMALYAADPALGSRLGYLLNL